MKLSRRDVLASMLGVPLATRMLAGCDAREDSARKRPLVGGFVGPSMALGHRVREAPPPDEAFARAPTREVDAAIVGAGPAGLSAAWQLAREGVRDFAVLELEPSAGGTSASGSNAVTAFPWGAHYVTTPLAHNADLIALLREVDALVPDARSPHPTGREELLVRAPKERVFYKGFYYPGLYLRVGASADDLAQLARFEARVEAYAALRDGRGRRAFAIPVDHGSDDADIAALARISAREWLDAERLTSPRLRWLLDYACRDDYGMSLEHTSAWALLFYHAARLDPEHDHESEVITWPEGNGALCAHLLQATGTRLATGKLVLDVVPQPSTGASERVALHVLDARDQRLERVLARRVIVAAPRFVAARIVRPLRDAGERARDFAYGAWLVANLQLAGRPPARGEPPAWDSVLYDSPSLGYVSATHQRGRDHGPTVWTYYLPMTDADPAAGRARLAERSFEELAEVVVSDLERAHPDLRTHLQRIDVCRYGHGMVQPRVGFAFSEARRRAREPLGAVHFAHSDLSGVALFEEAFHHGVRAAREVAAALRQKAVPT